MKNELVLLETMVTYLNSLTTTDFDGGRFDATISHIKTVCELYEGYQLGFDETLNSYYIIEL